MKDKTKRITMQVPRDFAEKIKYTSKIWGYSTDIVLKVVSDNFYNEEFIKYMNDTHLDNMKRIFEEE